MKTYIEFISEKIIIPNVDSIIELVKNFKKSVTGPMSDKVFVKKINSVLAQNKKLIGNIDIKFIVDNSPIVFNEPLTQSAKKHYLYSAQADKSSIDVLVLPYIGTVFFNLTDVNFEGFLTQLKEFLLHERIHNIQFSRMKVDKKFKFTTDMQDPENYKLYLSDEHEIMTWAKDCAAELYVRCNRDITKTLNILKTFKKHLDSDIFKDSVFSTYYEYVGGEDKIFKKFMKYTTEYLEQVERII